MSRDYKQGVIMSDFHSGHVVGLITQDSDLERRPDRVSRAYKPWRIRKELRDFVTKELEPLRPIDFGIFNGDLIAGKGERSGGTENMIQDRHEQAEAAADVINIVDAKTVGISYGTPYHTGKQEDFENHTFECVNTDDKHIGGVNWMDANGLVINYRHHIGSSSVPHGRFTALAREWEWSKEWARRNEFPLPHLIVRSHVHYFKFEGDADWTGIITPGLQGYGSKFGARKVSGTVDVGFVSLKVWSADRWEWTPHIVRFQWLRRDVIKV